MSHGHQHGAAAGQHRGPLLTALAITTAVLVTGVVGAALTGSLALLADAGHALTDAGGLLVAVVAATLALRPATARRTWGLRRAEVLGATVQAAVLLGVGLAVVVEGVRRLVDPPPVLTGGMVVYGVVGLVGNLAAYAVLRRAGAGSLNLRAATLEVAVDGIGSLGVLLAALVIATTGWVQADAVVSLLIGALIVPRTVVLLRETVDVLLESTPRGLDLDEVRDHLLALPHVLGVHDLHASSVASDLPVLTAHIVLDESCFNDGHAPVMLDDLQRCVSEHFPVPLVHSTFQLESAAHADHEHQVHA